MKRTMTVILGLILAVLSFSQSAMAQSSDGDIHVRITKDFNGERRTLDKTYSSERKMREDPEYQEFSGNNSFSFHFPGHEDSFVQIDRFDDEGSFFFNFNGDEDNRFHLNSNDFEELNEELREHLEEINESIERIDFSEFSNEFSRRFQKNMDDTEDYDRKNFSYSTSTSLSIQEVEERDFNGKGMNNTLKLQSLRVNPTSGYRFNLNFKTPEEGELSIKISNARGKDVYSNYFESFSGFFNETIDFSKRESGNYLLEISIDNKVQSKKIIVD